MLFKMIIWMKLSFFLLSLLFEWGDLQRIIHKIFEINSSFRVKWRTAEIVQFPFFRGFLLVLAAFSFRGGEWALGNNSMKFCDFSDISYFPKMLSFNIYTSLLLIIMLCFTYGEREICSTIKKSQNILNMIVCNTISTHRSYLIGIYLLQYTYLQS